MQSNITRIGARKCIVKEIDRQESIDFVETYHKHGAAGKNIKMKAVGLFYDEELLAVAQFCSPRTSEKKREYTTELLRLCFKEGYRVQGGASKIIKWYIQRFDPSDVFTYQDTSGESTSVYEQSGFRLVKQAKTKDYLVAAGKTLSTALRKEYFSMATVSSRGPDALLGTSLGEVFREDGKRKTNPELFIEDLGWHKESTTGDRVYEWINDNHSHYVYKTTASNSDKYYYGVRTIKLPRATESQCLSDGYYGSGGAKFSHWRSIHSGFLQKSIIAIYPRKAEAYLFEKKVVSSLFKDDPLCLNSREGGVSVGINPAHFRVIEDELCPIHGLVKHLNKKCFSCQADAKISVAECPIHGSVKHLGDFCYSCMNTNAIEKKTCSIHGEVNHRGSSCLRCINARANHVSICDKHGETAFQGLSCAKCSSESAVSLQECATHGETKHQGNKCRKCVAEGFMTLQECVIHGLVKHVGDSCYSCKNEKSISLKVCSIHGEVKHSGSKCYSCSMQSSVSERECPVHGLSKHIGDKCYSCRQTGYYLDDCSVHGETKFRAGNCEKCSSKSKLKSVVACSLCHEDFAPANNRQKICSKDHYVKCEYCEKEMLYVRRKKTCSLSCGVRLSNLKKSDASADE